jgi:hypothetical protein
MVTIVLEHHFDGAPFDLDRYNAAQERNAPCLEIHCVRHIVSYVSPDGHRMVCVFEAPDAEAVRQTARQLGYGYDSVWAAAVVR